MIKIIFKVSPLLQTILGKQKKRKKKATNMFVYHMKASAFLDQWAQRNIKSEGRLVGGWKPFAETNVNGVFLKGRWVGTGATRRFDTTAKLLQDKGDLRKSIKPFATRRDGGIRSVLQHAIDHHEGKGHLPERRILPKKREVIKDIRKIYRRHVKSALA